MPEETDPPRSNPPPAMQPDKGEHRHRALRPGHYRRAFDWRLSSQSQDNLQLVAGAFSTLSDSEYAETFEDYLEISRKRVKNRTALVKLQLHLVEELVVAQHAVKHYRQKLEEMKASVATPLPERESQQLEEDVKIAERELFFHRAHSNCIRAIGDGIAWRALGYDRAALRALAGRQTKQ